MYNHITVARTDNRPLVPVPRPSIRRHFLAEQEPTPAALSADIGVVVRLQTLDVSRFHGSEFREIRRRGERATRFHTSSSPRLLVSSRRALPALVSGEIR